MYTPALGALFRHVLSLDAWEFLPELIAVLQQGPLQGLPDYCKGCWTLPIRGSCCQPGGTGTGAGGVRGACGCDCAFATPAAFPDAQAKPNSNLSCGGCLAIYAWSSCSTSIFAVVLLTAPLQAYTQCFQECSAMPSCCTFVAICASICESLGWMLDTCCRVDPCIWSDAKLVESPTCKYKCRVVSSQSVRLMQLG